MYQPFGASASGGSNPYQFTGRENDGTGLDYYRARYYSPTFQRFIGQDPLDFGGGDFNLYGYVSEDPSNLTDPAGEGFLDCGKQIANLVDAFNYFWGRYQEHECRKNCATDPYNHHKSLQDAARRLLDQAKTTERACKSPIVEAIKALLQAAEAGAECGELTLPLL